MASSGRSLIWVALLASLLQPARAAEVLLLQRDWVPTGCSAGGCGPNYPDNFAVGALYVAPEGGAAPQPATGCGGKGGLRREDYEAAGLQRSQLDCAWQNHTAGLNSLQTSWKVSWDTFGRCTPAQSAAEYLGMGIQLDLAYPLPQDLPEKVDGSQLAAAIADAYGAAPLLQCDGQWLRSVVLCFDPAGVGSPEGPPLLDCPWPQDPNCSAQLLSLVRNAGGLGECGDYFAAGSPVQLRAGAAAAPAPAPAPAPAADAPAAEAAPAPGPEPAEQTAPELLTAAPAAAPAAAPGSTAAAAPALAPASAPAESPAADAGSADSQVSAAAADANAASSGEGSSGGGGTSTGSMVAALAGGVAGGIALGCAAVGAGYIVWRRRRRAAPLAAAAKPGLDVEKGFAGSPSSAASTDSWQSSGGGGATPLPVAAALPRRTVSERSSGGSGRLYRQLGSGAAGSPPSSPTKLYRQPSSKAGSPHPASHAEAGASSRHYAQPPAGSHSHAHSPAKRAQQAASPGGGTRSPGRLYSQPSPAARRQLSLGAAAAALPTEGEAVDNPLWTLALQPPAASAQPAAVAAAAGWTTNPISEEAVAEDRAVAATASTAAAVPPLAPAAGAVDNPLWAVAPQPPAVSAQPTGALAVAAPGWTANPLSEEEGLGGGGVAAAAPATQPAAARPEPPAEAAKWQASAPQW